MKNINCKVYYNKKWYDVDYIDVQHNTIGFTVKDGFVFTTYYKNNIKKENTSLRLNNYPIPEDKKYFKLSFQPIKKGKNK